MKTDIVRIGNEDALQLALREASRASVYNELSARSALHLQLLTEEVMGMIRSIAGDPAGEFWIESEAGVFQLHLKVETSMDDKKRQQLLSASSTGKNEATRSFMGKLRAVFEFICGNGDDALFANPLMMGDGARMYGTMVWSMKEYEQSVRQLLGEKREGAEEAWDELEKSVVSHVADDVRVSIQGNEAELIVIKKMA